MLENGNKKKYTKHIIQISTKNKQHYNLCTYYIFK